MTASFALPTERLQLRSWRAADHAALLAICSDPEVMAHLGPPQTADDIHAALERQSAAQAAHGHCFWAIERREDNCLLGFCGLQPGPAGTPLSGRMEIGWRLRADAWGQGYAREAAQASLAWAWANLDATSVWAMTTPGNTRSWGLMERLGMTRDPSLDFDHPAVPADSPLLRHIVYSIGRPS